MKNRTRIAILAASVLLLILIVYGCRYRVTISRTYTCDSNMSQLYGAKEQYSMKYGLTDEDIVTPDQVSLYIKGGWQALDCPSGGTYTIGKLDEDPQCSVHGTPRSGLIYRY